MSTSSSVMHMRGLPEADPSAVFVIAAVIALLCGYGAALWETGEWLAPINLMAAKIVKFGGQPVSIVGGVRYWADSTDTGPHGVGARLGMTFLFPKR
jgi:hypothetical protein